MEEKIKVLIVEDDNDLATMYKIKFEKEGFEVKIADNWINAVSAVTNFLPNVILLDIMMPTMDWFETLRVIRELAPSLKCKIIMFSNINSKEDIDKCMKSWADSYLLKAQTTPKEAVNKIYELLGLSENKESCDMINQKTCPHCGQTIKVSVEISKMEK